MSKICLRTTPNIHAKTSLYYLNKRIKACRSCGVQQVPRSTYFRSLSVPKLIFSCDSMELWVLALAHPWKKFSRSYIFSNDTTPLGMRFPILALATSYNAFSFSSSSIVTSLNTLAFTMKHNSCWSS